MEIENEEQELFDLTAIVSDQEFRVWFTFRGTMQVEIKYLPLEKRRAILAECVKTVMEGDKSKTETDMHQFGILLAKEAVTGWIGAVAGGKPLPCTPELVEKVARNLDGFGQFVILTCGNLERMLARKKELERKNSGSSSGQGNSTTTSIAKPAAKQKRKAT